MELKQESTVAPLKLEDLNSRRSPSPVRKTAKTAKHAPKTLLDEQIPTDTELKAQERNLAKKKRQMALLEEQLKVWKVYFFMFQKLFLGRGETSDNAN